MPQFRYTIQTQSGAVVTDTTIAESAETAKMELEHLGNKVLNISAVMLDQKGARRTFTFEGIDPNGNKVSGKIKTQNEESAMAKLGGAHGLREIKLVETTVRQELNPEEQENTLREAQMILIKASSMLSNFKSDDPNHTQIQELQEKLGEYIQKRDFNALKNEGGQILESLQKIEEEAVVSTEESSKEEVTFNTEQLIEQVKREAEELKKDPRYLRLNTILGEVHILTRWLLIFYAAYFTFAELVVAKKLNVPLGSFITSSLNSPLLYKVTLVIFVAYLFAKIKLTLLESTFLPALALAFISGILVMSLFFI